MFTFELTDVDCMIGKTRTTSWEGHVIFPELGDPINPQQNSNADSGWRRAWGTQVLDVPKNGWEMRSAYTCIHYTPRSLTWNQDKSQPTTVLLPWLLTWMHLHNFCRQHSSPVHNKNLSTPSHPPKLMSSILHYWTASPATWTNRRTLWVASQRWMGHVSDWTTRF